MYKLRRSKRVNKKVLLCNRKRHTARCVGYLGGGAGERGGGGRGIPTLSGEELGERLRSTPALSGGREGVGRVPGPD